MNPELQRNLWLEMTPRRMGLATAMLALVFIAISLVAGYNGLAEVAEALFYILVVLWGARAASQAVVGEIRDRTWDVQRLSALTPFEMTWGKLLGSTSYSWFGGALCLLVMIPIAVFREGPARGFAELAYYLFMGLEAQAAALLASLLAVRRRQNHSRFDVLFYQAAGLMAAFAVWWVWSTTKPGSQLEIDAVPWWGIRWNASVFYVASLVVFSGWTCVGCYRLMRVELQLQSRPWVWLGFLVFVAAYVAGFDVLGQIPDGGTADLTAIRLMAAAGTLSAFTYLAAVIEPKDRVLYRWLRERAGSKRWREALGRLQGWMVSAVLTLVAVIALLAELGPVSPLSAVGSGQIAMLVLAGLGFLVRDLGVLLFYPMLPGQRRGETAALVTLAILYAVAPQILGGLGLAPAMALFYPAASILGVVVAWAEAIGAWVLVFYMANKTWPMEQKAPLPAA